MLKASVKEANTIYQAIHSHQMNNDGEMLDAIKALTSVPDKYPDDIIQSPLETCSLTILPNSKCNFSCSYCYASKGHTGDELSLFNLEKTIDFFIDPKRTSNRNLYISFGGGGEPFLSWDIVKHALNYASQKAHKFGFTIHFSFASNGSLISKEIIDTLKTYNVKANISFDILEDVQNLQRKNHSLVSTNLLSLLASNIKPSLNTIITPASVNRQEEMVLEIASKYPGLERLSFDPVIDEQLASNNKDLKDFYSSYIKGFFEARKLGKKYGIDVNSIHLRNTGLKRHRTCPGGFDLTPDGHITVCYLVSSPKEAFYKDFVYGNIREDGEIVLDEKKFASLINESTNNRMECRQCFARWHCGGGCLYEYSLYPPEARLVACDFIRQFTLKALLEQFDSN